MTLLLQAVGMAFLFSLACWPILQTDWAREQHAKAVRANQAAQECGVEFRKAQRVCAQHQE